MTIRNQITLLLSATFLLSACGGKPSGVKGKKGTILAKQTQDECPAADGTWTFGESALIQFVRTEGYLSLKHPELTDVVIADGKVREYKRTDENTKSGAGEASVVKFVTATCSKQVLKIGYLADGKTVQQTWTFSGGDFEMKETGGGNDRVVTGKRAEQLSVPEESPAGQRAY